MRVQRIVVLAGIVAWSAASGAAVAEAAKPDLRIAKLSQPPAAITTGGKAAISFTVANAGRRARAAHVGLWLSGDRRRGGPDVAVGMRRHKKLARRRSARGRLSVTVPATLPPGSYHLIACADARGKVKERNERNNCRASTGRATLAPPGLTPVPEPVATPAITATATPGPTGGEVTFPLGADPLSVTHTLQTDRAQTSRVESSGGTVAATAADGTQYALTIPSGALAGGVDITLTPVAAVNGSPLSGGLIGAVEILPHGLELLEPATLDITPSGSAGPVAGQTGFLSHAGGEDFHLYPLALGGGLSMQLTHFSTPGVAQATDADRQVILAHPPERRRAQYEQLMSELIRDTRIAHETNPESGLPVEAMIDILLGYYRDIVLPLVEKAYTDDTVATEATAELLSWARQVDLLTLQEHPRLAARRNAVFDNLAVIMQNAITKGYERCVNDHDLDYIARLVGLARAAALLGVKLDEAAFDKAQRCASFEVTLDSRFTESHGYVADDGRTAQTDGTWHVEALRVPVDITGLGTGAMRWKSFTFAQTLTYPCGSSGGTLRYDTSGTSTRPDESVTLLLGMDLNAREPGTPPPPARDIRLRMIGFDAVGETYQQTTVSHCGETPPPPADPTDEKRWRDHFNRSHGDELSAGFADWQVGTGDLIATKSYVKTNPATGVSENTSLEIWHTPLK